MSDNSGNYSGETYRTETTGDIGDLEVTIEIEGDDETLAGLIYSDLTNRADEIKQMIDHDIPAGATQTQVDVDWDSYLERRDEVTA